MGMKNLPMGAGSQPQHAFLGPFQNPQPSIRPQLLAQPNLNSNNRPVQYVQILENPNNDIEPVECNELWIRSRHIISIKENKETKNNPQ